MISTSGNLLTSCGDLKSSQLNSILILYIGLLDLVGALVKLCCVSSKYLIFINLALLAWQCFVFGFISGFCPYKNEFLACSNLLLLCKKGPFHTRRFCSKYFPQPFETHAHWVWYFSFVARFFSTAHIEDLVVYWDNLTIFLCFAHPFCLIRGKKVEVFFLSLKQNDAWVVLAQPLGPPLVVGFASSSLRPSGLGQHHPRVILFFVREKNPQLSSPLSSKRGVLSTIKCSNYPSTLLKLQCLQRKNCATKEKYRTQWRVFL